MGLKTLFLVDKIVVDKNILSTTSEENFSEVQARRFINEIATSI